jgi:two-component system nitrogen regulation response regulator GlnG
MLRSLPWHGNVRELRHALEHAAIVARGSPLLPEHFPERGSAVDGGDPAAEVAGAVRRWLAERLRQPSSTPPADLHGEVLRLVETALYAEVIRRVDGNRWEAARWLGLNRTTVRKKLAEYGLGDVGREE